MSGIHDLVFRLESVRMQIEQLKEAETALEAAIAAQIPDGEIVDEEGLPIAVVKPPTPSFRKHKAKELIPAEDRHKACDITAAMVKKYDPALYESCREVSGTASVEIIND